MFKIKVLRRGFCNHKFMIIDELMNNKNCLKIKQNMFFNNYNIQGFSLDVAP